VGPGSRRCCEKKDSIRSHAKRHDQKKTLDRFFVGDEMDAGADTWCRDAKVVRPRARFFCSPFEFSEVTLIEGDTRRFRGPKNLVL